MEKLNEINCYLLDMDGTIYLGDNLIDGAKEFLESIEKQGKNFIFMTNNSSKNSRLYQSKLAKYGIDTSKDKIFTSGEATTIYIKMRKPGATIFLLGNEYLHEEFIEAGFNVVNEKVENIDYVVLGFDTTLTYDKLWMACDLIRDGVEYIATHPDYNCPLAEGKFMPDTGSMIELIHASTGERPTIIGKPNKLIVDLIIEKYGLHKREVAMIGDRLYTDIKLGQNSNIKSILVLSGETDLELYRNQNDVKATFVFPSVKELRDELEKV